MSEPRYEREGGHRFGDQRDLQRYQHAGCGRARGRSRSALPFGVHHEASNTIYIVDNNGAMAPQLSVLNGATCDGLDRKSEFPSMTRRSPSVYGMCE